MSGMGVNTERYIRKPLYVDAVRVNAANFDEIARWCQGEILNEEVPGTGTTKKYIKVRVTNPKNARQTKAFVNDWILYTDRGYKVYTNKAFRAAFDQVEGVEPKVETETPTRLGNVSHTPGEKDQLAVQDLDKPLSEDEEQDLAAPEEIQEVRPGADLGTTPQGEQIEVIEATPEAIADAVNEQQPRTEHLKDEMSPLLEEEQTVPVDPALLEDSPPPVDEVVQAQARETSIAQPEPVSEQAPEDAAANKRVLSLEEQRQMGPDAVREMIRSGDVILAQDLAA